MNKDELMKNSFVISTNDRRLELFHSRFSIFEYQPKNFYGFTIPNGIYGNSGFIKQSNVINCTISHMAIIKMCKSLEYPFVCIFEDDACPRKDILEKLDYYLDKLPEDIDMLKFGTNCKNTITGENRLIKWNQTVGSHAYVIFRKYYDNYIELMNKTPIADETSMNNRKFNIYSTREILFIQDTYDNENRLHNNSIYRAEQVLGVDCVLKNFNRDEFKCNIG